MDHPFRTAAVGGFNRQDVLTYLETVSREAEEKQAQLEAELEEARKTAEDQGAELEALRSQAEQHEHEVNALRELIDRQDRELTELRDSQETSSGAAETYKAENERLKEEVAALRPSAEAYDSIKERTAGLELEAHHRAQLVEEEADQQAARVHREMEDWARKVEQEYGEIRGQVEDTVARAMEQLNRAGHGLDQINGLLDHRKLELEELLSEYGR